MHTSFNTANEIFVKFSQQLSAVGFPTSAQACIRAQIKSYVCMYARMFKRFLA